MGIQEQPNSNREEMFSVSHDMPLVKVKYVSSLVGNIIKDKGRCGQDVTFL